TTNEKNNPVMLAIREELDDKGPDGKPVAREGTYHLKVETLLELPAIKDKAEETPFRQAVRKARELLHKHARSFPQEFWAQDSDEEMKTSITEMQKDVVTIQAKFQAALEELERVGPDRAKETSLGWKAYYDCNLARLSSFIAYVDEYNFLLAQLKREPPKRDPKIHRGWRMTPDDKLQSGADAKKLVAEANKIWEQLAQEKELKGTKFAELAEQGRKTQVGLKWVPTGGTKTVVHLNLGAVKYDLDPLKIEQDV